MTKSWTALIPVKGLEAAKSRLSLPAPVRRGIVLAMLADVLSAVQAEPRVGSTRVITHDHEVARLASASGARPWSRASNPGLNPELAAIMTRIGSHADICIVMPDLASLSSESFGQVLSAAPSSSAAFVPDLDGTGTSMLLLPAGIRLAPRFGYESAARHRAVAVEMGHAPVQARLDVDHLVDLVSATQWGLGSCTATWLDRHRRTVDRGLRTQLEGVR